MLILDQAFQEFIARYAGVSQELGRILGYRFIHGSRANNSHLGRLLVDILNYHNQGDYFSRNAEMNRLMYFINHLQTIEQHDPNLLAKFRKELRKQDTHETYWGIKFEAAIASGFLKKGIYFTKRESPDFIVDNIQIECTSVRTRKSPTKLDYSYKLRSAIRKKIHSGYCKFTLALFLDYTNILHLNTKYKLGMNSEGMRTFVQKEINQLEIGSIVLFATVQANDGIMLGYNRIDHERIDPDLRRFLDNYYPIGKLEIESFGVTQEG